MSLHTIEHDRSLTVAARWEGMEAVVVATPDHTHSVFTMAAIKRGGHVYVEKPPRPEGLGHGQKLPDIGAYVLGDKGGIVYGSHGAGEWSLFPGKLKKAYKQPPATLPRVSEPGAYFNGHHQDWLNAIRTGGRAGSDFTYGGPLTEIALLGAIALRFPGRELKWDTQNVQFTNHDEATKLVKPTFRDGWAL